LLYWLFPRVLLAAIAATLGALAGIAIGWAGDVQIVLTIAGAALGAGLAALLDRMRGYRLMKWLAGDPAAPAPAARAFWGELGYRAERALRERDRRADSERTQREDFLSAIEASPNGVLLVNAHQQIEWLSAAAAEHFGLDPKRDLQQRITNLVRDPAFVAHLQAEDFDQAIVFPGLRGLGTLSVTVRRYGDDKLLVLSQDITERERADAMRRDFVANASHEIRTPLTVLAGFVETLTELPLTEVERQRVLSLMAQQTDRMQALVADLLTLAQLEGSPRPAPDTWVDLAVLLDRVEADGRALSAGRHALSVLADTPAQLAGNLTELQSAFGNLVSNAVRYTPVGGHIELRWMARADGGSTLEVRDSGPGIAREHLSRLTERFYRVDGSRSRETGGTGLGLSIVKHVMQRHGGEIEVESEVGRGSCFRLRFPAARVRQATALGTPGAHSGAAPAAPSGPALTADAG
jgi:two-component system, OmpR family, phosphate regulon sensor histidine kinase PhoR